MLIFFNEILNTIQSDINIYILVNFQMNPTICVNFFTFVYELLDSPSYISNSYTMACLPVVHADNPRALAGGLSYVQVDQHGISFLYPLHQCRLTLHIMR